MPMGESYTLLQFCVGVKYCLHHLQQQRSCLATYRYLQSPISPYILWLKLGAMNPGVFVPLDGKGGILGLEYSTSPVTKTPSYRLPLSSLFSLSFLSLLLQLLGVMQWNTLEQRVCSLPFVRTYPLFRDPHNSDNGDWPQISAPEQVFPTIMI